MSRGHGRVQRAILSHLADTGDGVEVPWLTIADLLPAAYQPPFTEAAYVATARAVKALHREGLVEVKGGGERRRTVRVRRLLTDAEAVHDRERERRRQEWFDGVCDRLAAQADGKV